MSANPTWRRTLREEIVDAARYHPGHEAHLEATEIPRFTEETGYVDVLDSLTEAVTRVDDKPRERICTLWSQYLTDGDLPMEKATDLLSALRAVQLDHLLTKAQEMVDEELQ